jgi:hypothetical protein
MKTTSTTASKDPETIKSTIIEKIVVLMIIVTYLLIYA